MILFYADSDTADPEVFTPVGAIPPCCVALKCDKTLSPARFVLSLHADYNDPDPAWEAKTVAEAEADYPGLTGGE
jgi:hypothetical protein